VVLLSGGPHVGGGGSGGDPGLETALLPQNAARGADPRLVEVKGLHALTLRTVDTELPTTPEVFEKGLNADYLSRCPGH